MVASAIGVAAAACLLLLLQSAVVAAAIAVSGCCRHRYCIMFLLLPSLSPLLLVCLQLLLLWLQLYVAAVVIARLPMSALSWFEPKRRCPGSRQHLLAISAEAYFT